MTKLSLERDARKYAKALLDLAKEQSIEQEIVSEINDLKLIFSDIFKKSNKNMRDEYTSIRKHFYILTEDKQKHILKGILNDLKVNSLIKNLAFILLHNHKLDVLEELIVNWTSIYKEYYGLQRVEIISALDLTEQQEAKIVGQLKEHLGKEFYIVKKVDKTILGGLIFNIGNTIYDDSLKNKVNKIQNNIKEISSYE